MDDQPVVSLDPSEVTPAELRELLTTARENNHMLRQMRFWGRVAFWFKVLVWTVVLILPIFLYSYFVPFLKLLPGGAGGASASSTSLFGFPSPGEVHNVFHPVQK